MNSLYIHGKFGGSRSDRGKRPTVKSLLASLLLSPAIKEPCHAFSIVVKYLFQQISLINRIKVSVKMQCEKLTLAEDPSWAFLYNSLFVSFPHKKGRTWWNNLTWFWSSLTVFQLKPRRWLSQHVVPPALVLFSFSSMSHVCVADVNKGAVMVLIYIVSSDGEDQGYLF